VKYLYRILFALTVFLSGVALVPVVGLPTAGFYWQRYADVDTPLTLEVNHLSGRPGSYFTVTGANYPPNGTVTIRSNGVLLGEVAADADGNLIFLINSTGALAGYYNIEADAGDRAFIQFQLDPLEPLWPQEATATVFNLPADSALQMIFLPQIRR